MASVNPPASGSDSFASIGLAGRSLLITGGSSGIGRAVALIAAGRGARITIADLDEVNGDELVETIGQSGGAAQFVRTDVSDEESVRAAVEAAQSVFGGLHAACNAAGMVFKGVPLHEISADFWDKVTAVNLRGMFLSMKYQVPAMLESGGGAIVNISSVAAALSFPHGSEYSTTKAGVVGLTRSAAVDYAKQNIRVNAVLPGSTRTPMLQQGMASAPELEKQTISRIPLGRLGEVDDIAYPICWLISDEARFVTGAMLAVDGGTMASL